MNHSDFLASAYEMGHQITKPMIAFVISDAELPENVSHPFQYDKKMTIINIRMTILNFQKRHQKNRKKTYFCATKPAL